MQYIIHDTWVLTNGHSIYYRISGHTLMGSREHAFPTLRTAAVDHLSYSLCASDIIVAHAIHGSQLSSREMCCVAYGPFFNIKILALITSFMYF